MSKKNSRTVVVRHVDHSAIIAQLKLLSENQKQRGDRQQENREREMFAPFGQTVQTMQTVGACLCHTNQAPKNQASLALSLRARIKQELWTPVVYAGWVQRRCYTEIRTR